MNAFADVQWKLALDKLEAAMIKLELFCDGGSPTLVGEAYAELMRCKGQLFATRQLVELEETIRDRDTARLAPAPVGLKLVGK